MKFVNYNLKEYINKGLASIGFYETTEIQELVIPKLLKWESIIGKSATGTGKTHSFLIPMLENLDEDLHEVQFVIVAPTRELAFQLQEEVIKITKFYDGEIDVRLYIGGTNRDSEIKRLEKSQPQIVIGTIGKLCDLAHDKNLLKLYTAKSVIIDEADMVFGTKEGEDIDKVFSLFENLRSASAFSATIPNGLTNFINRYLLDNNQKRVTNIDLSNKQIGKNQIEYIFIPTKNLNKLELLHDLLKSFTPYLVLIFANTKEKVNEIASYLGENGIKVISLTGDLESRERKSVLKRIKDGDVQYVVCSDIASRGIDIEGVSHVINYELPKEIEFFIHRVGRCARYDLTGCAISLYDYNDDDYLNNLRKKGLNCVYKKLQSGTLVNIKKGTVRNTKPTRIKKIEEDVHMRTPMPKKVKPGYKKKRKEQIEHKLRYMKHQRIDEMYFKNVHKKKMEEDK